MPDFITTASDNFTRANENPLNPANWTECAEGAALQVISNQCTGQSDAIGEEYYSGISFPDNQWAQITIAACDNSFVGVFVRCQGTILLWYQALLEGTLGNTCEIVLTVGETILSTFHGIVNVGDDLLIYAIGSEITVALNSVTIMQANDSTYANGSPGLLVSITAAASDFQAGVFGSAPILASFEGTTGNSLSQQIPGVIITILDGTLTGGDAVDVSVIPGTPLATIYADPYGQSQIPQQAVSLSGTASTVEGSPDVTWESGSLLSIFLVGQQITIDGTPYTVGQVTSALTLVLTSNAGVTGTNSFSATIPASPLVSDDNGNFQFWAANGYYVIQMYGNGIAGFFYDSGSGPTWIPNQYYYGIFLAIGGGGGGSGSVTSVGLTDGTGGLLSISGSPVTSSGDITIALSSQSENLFLASPDGSSGAPTMRAIVADDLPFATTRSYGIIILDADLGGSASLPTVVSTHLTDPLPIAQGGSGLATTSQGFVFIGPVSGPGAPTWRALTSSDVPAGIVSSVGMTGDGIIFNPTVTGSPITSSGTLIPALLTQTANKALMGPASGSAATPTFRDLVAADLPSAAILTFANGEQPVATLLAFTLDHTPNNIFLLGFRNTAPMIYGTDFTLSGANGTLATDIGPDTLTFWYTH